ncbi:hypothetical protein FRACYDRAFT_246746 [Fragilariopsis cylindrus CCMP1102]|uniref:FAD-binding domain-containing protein n=1 Tax=Fragilariopsis cylindrus CCMP1102 TaxID=635003 RepID=A0A1E7EY77_9STRA|nr:hypothetical protein FRACYDRAFT_246746 [Fragilariopsis cylindrus CCMP1102]|eukprot:OEU10872.1 hypothetical protein FRACYDRAFT_246746 [Fragilariopsis cylindrus CCMP1102]
MTSAEVDSEKARKCEESGEDAVVVVERAPELRLGGQSIDIAGAAQEAADLMGIEDDIHEHRTIDTCWMIKELEILRGDPARIIYDKTTTPSESTTEAKCECDYIFGDYAVIMEENEEHVTVTFESEKKRNFDLIVAADGSRSKTREDLDEAVLKPLGPYIASFTVPKCDMIDNNMARWYNSTGSCVMLLRPDRLGTTTRVVVVFMSPPKSYERLPQNE